MIWLCGDTHGTLDLQKVEDYFENLSCYQEVSKNDYLIILGDVGVCWDGGINDAYVISCLQNLPCTVLWLDGNHENFDIIEEYPVVSNWNGGKVQFIAQDVIHLMRGQVYKLDGKSFFVFGGGNSIDKQWRTPGVSWWENEMPSEQEYEEGLQNLEKVDYTVDYVLTHTCPGHIAHMLVSDVYSGEEELQNYFDDISQKVDFVGWYFGHWHMDWMEGEYQCLWDDIVAL